MQFLQEWDPFDGEVAAARKWATALTQANGLQHTGLRWLERSGRAVFVAALFRLRSYG